jgi:hypothetical protein
MRSPIRVFFFSLLFFGGLSALMVLHYGGSLMNDFAVRGDRMLPHPTARVISAKCTRYYFAVSACSIEYDDRFVVPTASKKFKPRHELNYLMFGSAAGERVALLQPASRPDIVTTSAGLAHLGNRMVTLFVSAGLCLVAMLALISKAMTRRNKAVAPPMQTAAFDAAKVDDTIARQQMNAVSPSGFRGPAVQPGSSPGFGRRGLAR